MLTKSKMFHSDVLYIQDLWDSYLLNKKVSYRNDYYDFFEDSLINGIIDSVCEGAHKLNLPFYKKRHSNITIEDILDEKIWKDFEQILNVCWEKYIDDANGYFDYEKAIMLLLKKNYSSS